MTATMIVLQVKILFFVFVNFLEIATEGRSLYTK